MNQRELLGMLGGGLLGAWSGEARTQDAFSVRVRFASVDWERYAVMTKPTGAESPWRLRLEVEHQAARAGKAAVARLLDHPHHGSPHVRSLAAQMLGVIGEPESKARLGALLT